MCCYRFRNHQEDSYNYVDAALSASDSPNYEQIFAEDVTMLIRPVYTSVAYGFTVLGGYLILLTALAWLERRPKSKSSCCFSCLSDW